MMPRLYATLLPVGLALATACGATPMAVSGAEAAAPDGSPATAAPTDAPTANEDEDEGGFYSLLTVPPAHHPAAPPVPEVEERPTTSGTCVGEPSKAALKKTAQAMCCYTPPSFFMKHIHERRDAMKACYNDALARDPKTSGRVVSKFTIEEDGHIAQACDAGSNVGDPKLVECVLKTMTTVTFPAYTIGDPCPAFTIMYPIQFSPTAE